MPIERIDTNQCSGCADCFNTCPLDVIRFDDEKLLPYIAYPEDCDFCMLCEKSCSLGCIYVSTVRYQQLPLP